jgi:hypothetical protein
MAFRPAPKRRPSLAHRLLDQKTVWQRALIAETAVATAIPAVAGVVALLLPLFRPAPDTAAPSTPGPSPAVTRGESAVPGDRVLTSAGLTVVRTQTAEADALVRRLIDTAGKAPILLDHKIMGAPGPADVTLYYACGSTGTCSTTRIQAPKVDGMAVLTGGDGVWFQGCFAVARKGAGYGADYLDLALTKVGDACPT